jgi:hypothetical protein
LLGSRGAITIKRKIMPRNKYKNLEKRKAYLKEYNKVYTAARRKINKEFIKNSKDKPCMDCGIKYPYYVMDFDHRKDKKFNIGRAREHNINKVKEEITKCDVVCANCHRERTYRKDYYGE